LGFSKRKHLPVVKIGHISLPIWKYRYAQRVAKMIGKLILDEYAKKTIINELAEFENFYLPPFSLKGKTVLDIGACCGETAYFYLQRGAEKVICIEPDPNRVELIKQNKNNFNLNIELINTCFEPSHLLLLYDFIKCDIEGSEVKLIPFLKQIKPCVLEAHGDNIRTQFEKNGFHTIHHRHNYYLMTNY
jgi:2-polyprenyl-3-methyl-5-hydroxy-6-metoxy-1,4-benzoquinol methylase